MTFSARRSLFWTQKTVYALHPDFHSNLCYYRWEGLYLWFGGVFRHYYFFLDGTLGKNVVVVVSVFFYRVIRKWCATQAVIFTILWLTIKNQLKDCGILYS